MRLFNFVSTRMKVSWKNTVLPIIEGGIRRSFYRIRNHCWWRLWTWFRDLRKSPFNFRSSWSPKLWVYEFKNKLSIFSLIHWNFWLAIPSKIVGWLQGPWTTLEHFLRLCCKSGHLLVRVTLNLIVHQNNMPFFEKIRKFSGEILCSS